MGKCPLLGIIALALLGACTPNQAPLNDGPLLVQENTLAPTTPAPTRALSATPTPLIVGASTVALSTDNPSPTSQSGFVLITPTLPPSKTPTRTPTVTLTTPPTRTPTPRPTFSSNSVFATPFAIPTSGGVVPLPTAIVVNPPSQSCSTAWFFTTSIAATCPLNPPLVSPGSFQPFQFGMMIWVAQQDAIYVLYDTVNPPRWQVYNDGFQDGMPDTDPAFNNAPPSTWQPRRGFGLLWRIRTDVSGRIGWATTEAELPFTTQVQIGADGVIFIAGSQGDVYSLRPDGADWQRFAS